MREACNVPHQQIHQTQQPYDIDVYQRNISHQAVWHNHVFWCVPENIT